MALLPVFQNIPERADTPAPKERALRTPVLSDLQDFVLRHRALQPPPRIRFAALLLLPVKGPSISDVGSEQHGSHGPAAAARQLMEVDRHSSSPGGSSRQWGVSTAPRLSAQPARESPSGLTPLHVGFEHLPGVPPLYVQVRSPLSPFNVAVGVGGGGQGSGAETVHQTDGPQHDNHERTQDSLSSRAAAGVSLLVLHHNPDRVLVQQEGFSRLKLGSISVHDGSYEKLLSCLMGLDQYQLEEFKLGLQAPQLLLENSRPIPWASLKAAGPADLLCLLSEYLTARQIWDVTLHIFENMQLTSLCKEMRAKTNGEWVCEMDGCPVLTEQGGCTGFLWGRSKLLVSP
ncbi:hypothetical protein CB1_000305015 [Camelus ferus]|nr:hypothetical protein CB1_000305015 [Camelus ferus]